MGGDGYQFGVIAVEVDLNQVAALLVEDSYAKQSAVTELVQHSQFGGIRARQVDACSEGAALGERLGCARIVGKRVDDILILRRTEYAQPRVRVERTRDAADGADRCVVACGDGEGPARAAARPPPAGPPASPARWPLEPVQVAGSACCGVGMGRWRSLLRPMSSVVAGSVCGVGQASRADLWFSAPPGICIRGPTRR